MKNQSITNHIDWISVALFITMVLMGWLNIYSSSLSAVTGDSTIFDLSQFYGKQLLYIALTFPLVLIILFVEGKFYEKYSSIIYTISVLSIAGLYVFGKSVKGQANWYSFGSFGIQPSEFAKAATALALAKYLSDVQVNLKLVKDQIVALAIVFFPMVLIAGHDPGSALIYIVFLVVLFREGLPGWYLFSGFAAILLFILMLITNNPYIVIGIAAIALVFNYLRSRLIERNIIASGIMLVLVAIFSFSVSFVFNNVFKQHHRDRFNILL